jgi:hypothetical protein
VDFTGGVAEKLLLSNFAHNDPNCQLDLFNKLKDAMDDRALLNCNFDVRKSFTDLYLLSVTNFICHPMKAMYFLKIYVLVLCIYNPNW